MALLSLVMDFLVLAALAGGIYYAMRLGRSLDNFRAHREALRAVVADLSKNIDEAARAIEGLRNASDAAAEDLDGSLRDARKMAEELKMINETGDGLASRLEKLAERNRRIAQDVAVPPGFTAADHEFDEPHRPARSGSVDAPSFAIRDRDMGDYQEENWSDEPGEFSSQAEKDLYEALKKNRKAGGGSF